jgi:hypothetical protein
MRTETLYMVCALGLVALGTLGTLTALAMFAMGVLLQH